MKILEDKYSGLNNLRLYRQGTLFQGISDFNWSNLNPKYNMAYIKLYLGKFWIQSGPNLNDLASKNPKSDFIFECLNLFVGSFYTSFKMHLFLYYFDDV